MDAAFVEKYSEKLNEKSVCGGNTVCQLWTGTRKRSKYGFYGVIRIYILGNYKTVTVHRISYSINMNVYPLPQDLDVSHLCHNPLCINIDHLSLEPHYINNNRQCCIRANRCLGHGEYSNCLLNLRLPD